MTKLNALFIGNCQNSGIIDLLNKHKKFSDTYTIKSHANWQLLNGTINTPIMDLRNADLFIYQPLKDVYGCYSTNPTSPNSIVHLLKPDCIKISYPYIYNSAMWPICQTAYRKNRWFGWEPIHKLLKNNLQTKDVLHLYETNQIDWEYNRRYEETTNIYKEKESHTDIKLFSYLENNLKHRLLYLIPQHPTSCVFYELANQILQKLNMKRLEDVVIENDNESGLPDSTYERKDNMFPIHESTIDHFGLTFGHKYMFDAKEFYRQRILDYISMNGVNCPDNYKAEDLKYDHH